MRNRQRGRLSPAIVVWRAAHGLIAIGFLVSIAYVWWCALTGGRGWFLRPAIAALLGEGVVVAANHGDCPLDPLGRRIGDPVPLFELALSPRAARWAVPALGAVTVLGIGVLVVRPPETGFPSAGAYRLFLQFDAGGHARTAEFSVNAS